MRSRLAAALATAALIAVGPAAQAAASVPAGFSTVPSPNVKNSDYNALNAVAAVTPGDAWAVGLARVGTKTLYHALIEHWNGTAWSVAKPAKLPASQYTWLRGVSARSASDVWAVGADATSGHSLIEHWNGTAWAQVSQPATGYDAALGSVAVVSRDDVWAVGERNLDHTVTEHWNGTAWAVVPSPSHTADNAQDNLTGVAALGASDVWAVGSWAPEDRSSQTLAEHWNGTKWQFVPTTDPAAGNLLSGVSGTVTGAPLWVAGSAVSGGTPQSGTLVETTTG